MTSELVQILNKNLVVTPDYFFVSLFFTNINVIFINYSRITSEWVISDSITLAVSGMSIQIYVGLMVPVSALSLFLPLQ